MIVDDKNSIYQELEKLARQQAQLLEEMEKYESYQEPDYEDLAQKLKVTVNNLF